MRAPRARAISPASTTTITARPATIMAATRRDNAGRFTRSDMFSFQKRVCDAHDTHTMALQLMRSRDTSDSGELAHKTGCQMAFFVSYHVYRLLLGSRMLSAATLSRCR